MQKISILLFCAALVLGGGTGASAIDFKAKGQWLMSFDYGQNGKFEGKYNGHQSPGYDGKEDDFEARQRVRLSLDAVASESLSGSVLFEIGSNIWGKASGNTGGAALGADSTGIIKLRGAYLDWMIPETDLKVRMGIQGLAIPNFVTGGGFVLNDDVAGITTSAKINNLVSVTAFWIRPYNDNYEGNNASGLTTRNAYMDNMDAFGLLVPLSFEGVKITPWGIYAATGPNTFRASNNASSDFFGGSWTATSKNYTLAGMFPIGGALHKNGKGANKEDSRRLNQYGNAWWGGLTGQVSIWDPFRLAWDFTYGSSTWEDDGRLNRQGWMASLLAEYKLDWATPGLYAWYTSGDDSNPANGSERMPMISGGNSKNQLSAYAFNNGYTIARDEVISGKNGSMVGTWGIGARLKDMRFVQDLKHTLRVNYIGGTNSASMAKKLSLNGLWANGKTLTPKPTDYAPAAVGQEGLYMTTGDSALEFGLTNTYKMYENFEINCEAAYVALWLDTSKSAWGARHKEGRSIPETKDAWNINVTFNYSF